MTAVHFPCFGTFRTTDPIHIILAWACGMILCGTFSISLSFKFNGIFDSSEKTSPLAFYACDYHVAIVTRFHVFVAVQM